MTVRSSAHTGARSMTTPLTSIVIRHATVYCSLYEAGSRGLATLRTVLQNEADIDVGNFPHLVRTMLEWRL